MVHCTSNQYTTLTSHITNSCLGRKQHSQPVHTNIKDTVLIPTDGVAVYSLLHSSKYNCIQKRMLFKSASNHIHTQQQTICNTMLDTAAPLYKQFLQEMLLRTHVIANTEPNVGHNCINV